MKLAPLNLDPEELIANYKPLPPQTEFKKKKSVEDTDQLAKIMTTKNMRYNKKSCFKLILFFNIVF